MDLNALLNDALPLTVALLTLVTAGGGIGLWIGVLSSRQKQTQTDLERLETEFDEFITLLETSDNSRVERLREFMFRARGRKEQ